MIDNQKKYEKFIKTKGVGSNDKVADSVRSYVSYLNSVCRHLKIKINSKTLSSREDIENISSGLKMLVSTRTIQNYRTAMRRYIEMIEEENN